MKAVSGVKTNYVDKRAAAEQRRRKPKQKHNSVMYACSVSLAAAHIIGPDANEVLKAYEVGKGRERGMAG